ncbi:hypothetical protein KQH62_04600 [bacterium]|nr:hypothetical protein [bacterium]
MKNTAIRLIISLILVFTIFPAETVYAVSGDIEGYELWDTDQLMDGDVIIKDGGHLEIRNATITMSCTDKPKIEVQPGGRLTITDSTLMGDGAYDCWQGILINSGDNLSSITDSSIFGAGYDANFNSDDGVSAGITIISSGPTIKGNYIGVLQRPDADSGDLYYSEDYFTAGIYIEGTDEDHVPTIRGNYIHDVFGPMGFPGADGDLEDGRGDDGQHGGMALGIYARENESVIIENNVIEQLKGGACGDGGDGLDGADGALGAAGETGYMGGAAGNPGLTIGIYVVNTTTSEITGNTVRNLYSSHGCNGGNGGDGGAGGAGADGTAVNPPGVGAVGGDGYWGGGASRTDRVVGIDVRSEDGSPQATTISGNTIHDLFGAMGGNSGNGGNGGVGGVGGSDTDASATAGYSDGGNGGSGGKGGYNGRSNSGSDAIGIYTHEIDRSDILGNKIYSLVAGDGQTGGIGGKGGTGGAGGNGGTNSLEIAGNGGDGGSGGEFGMTWATGNGGLARGVFVENRLGSINYIANNDIWDLTAGKGADGAKGGDGGDGGRGGDGGNGGVGGQGGDAYDGREGGHGGTNGDTYMVSVSEAFNDGDTGSTLIVNNTLVFPFCETVLSTGGPMGYAGTPGTGGDPDGPNGSGAADGSLGRAGDGALICGVFRGEGTSVIEVYNNILANTFPYADSYSIYDSWDGSGVISVINNNHLIGWQAGESLKEGVLLGPYTTGDPGFVSAVDHHLTEESPCVDVGDNGVANLPETDIDGMERIQDGDSDVVATVDAGAYELEGKLINYFIPIFFK